MESKHIKAVKEPWRCSNRFEALGQRLDKLSAAKQHFTDCGLMAGQALPVHLQPVVAPQQSAHELGSDEDKVDDTGAMGGEPASYSVELVKCHICNLPCNALELGVLLDVPHWLPLTQHFLYDHENPNAEVAGKVTVFPSAVTTFYAPSDQSGIGRMHRQIIQSTSSWRKGPSRHNCVFVDNGGDGEGFCGLLVARVRMFFSCMHKGCVYSCTLLQWFLRVADEPDEETGMWVVSPELDKRGEWVTSILQVFWGIKIASGIHHAAHYFTFPDVSWPCGQVGNGYDWVLRGN
ncbi:hypothetical protein HYDPIDRAFT_171208 [Hydnomerulius pinastri MD-312]|uniref:Uncharacterized protein n=1 Tax=Hydnomerulius pinastri MD-312 TaxID=994086 RepID=A0A0C9VLZ6_9AGAM|nr:hypothetical protein HYDPIDRAFT_171208 [Hydnomerulius pinastri MD-312]